MGLIQSGKSWNAYNRIRTKTSTYTHFSLKLCSKMAAGYSVLITQERFPHHCGRTQKYFGPASHRTVRLNHKQYRHRQTKHNLPGQKSENRTIIHSSQKIWHSSVLDIFVLLFGDISVCEVHIYVFPMESMQAGAFKRVCRCNQLFFNVNLLYG